METLQVIQHQSSRRRDLLRGMNLIFKNPLTTFGLLIIFVLMLTALFAPYVAPYPDQGKGQSNLSERLQPPSARHLMGTDNLGRDILSRLIFGTRIAIFVGITPVIIAGVFGGM